MNPARNDSRIQKSLRPESSAVSLWKISVVFLTLKPVEGCYFNDAYEPPGSLIYELYNSFRYLTESNKLNEVDLAQYKEMADDENFICDTANKNKKYADPYIKRNDE